jgi:hypothetical protein
MGRSVMFLVVAAALTFAAPIVSSSGALAKGSRCAAKTMSGKKIVWSCRAGQKCCFDWFANKGACVKASEICL